MTKREMFSVITKVAEDMNGNDSEFIWGYGEDNTPVKNDDVIAFCSREIELMDKRNSKRKSVSKLDDVNTMNALKDIVANNPKSSTKKIADGMGWTTQKASPYLKKLVEDNAITVEVEKGVKLYSIVAE